MDEMLGGRSADPRYIVRSSSQSVTARRPAVLGRDSLPALTMALSRDILGGSALWLRAAKSALSINHDLEMTENMNETPDAQIASTEGGGRLELSRRGLVEERSADRIGPSIHVLKGRYQTSRSLTTAVR
jgi:hypothetical protein